LGPFLWKFVRSFRSPRWIFLGGSSTACLGEFLYVLPVKTPEKELQAFFFFYFIIGVKLKANE
jgi:hypothetical protein